MVFASSCSRSSVHPHEQPRHRHSRRHCAQQSWTSTPVLQAHAMHCLVLPMACIDLLQGSSCFGQRRRPCPAGTHRSPGWLRRGLAQTPVPHRSSVPQGTRSASPLSVCQPLHMPAQRCLWIITFLSDPNRQGLDVGSLCVRSAMFSVCFDCLYNCLHGA